MINRFDSIYTSINNSNLILSRLKFYSFLRFSVRSFVNIIMPIYFRLNPTDKKLESKDDNKVIVSITTFPNRINKIWLVVECLLRQTRMPNNIILWLSKEQFVRGELDLPIKLLKYKKNGVEFRFVDEDLRSHKKYYYAFKEFPKDIIITVDDDLFYTDFLIESLLNLHEIFPNSICCHRGFVVNKDNNTILPYKRWQIARDFVNPTSDLFQTSGGGTLYKLEMLHPEVLNKEVFLNICLAADDVWLNFMAQMGGTKTVKSNYFSNYIPILNFNNINLSSYNVLGGGNDLQIRNLINYYNLNENELFNKNII